MIGERVALPLAAIAGSEAIGDAISEEFLYPVASRLIEQCDAVIRIEGKSTGTDADVRLARELGKRVYLALEEIPMCTR